MTCQHCGSNDITPIHGRNFCLECGYAVTAAASAGTKNGSKPASGSKASGKRPAGGAATAAAKAPAPPASGGTGGGTASRHRALDLHLKPRTRPPATTTSTSWWPAKAHPVRFSLRVAASLAVLVAAVVGLALGLHLDSDTGVYVLAAGLVAVIVSSVLAQSALLYGVARYEDGRATPRAFWWAAARSGFMDVINADMIAVIGVCLIVAAATVAWRVSLRPLPLSNVERAIGFAAVNVVLAWLLLGVYAARRIAVVAIVIGSVTAGEGTRLGWRLYWRTGGRLVAAALEALISRLVLILVLAAGVYIVAQRLGTASGTSSSQSAVIVASVAVAAVTVFIVVMVVLEWEARLWLRHYRYWVTSFSPAERVRLLTGRVHVKP